MCNTDQENHEKYCPLGIALGDLQASVYSILSSKPNEGAAIINISTSAQLTVVMPGGFEPTQADATKPEGTEYFPYFEGQYLAVAAALAGGNALATFISVFSEWLRELGCQLDKGKLFQRHKASSVVAVKKSNY